MRNQMSNYSITVQLTGQVDYNQFMDSDMKFCNTESNKLKFRFIPEMVIFADGSKLEMQSN